MQFISMATVRIVCQLVFLVSAVQGRLLRLNSSDNNLISDGIDQVTTTCDHQYGFLPCAENAPGYLFQMLVYQGLLVFGEKQIGIGSKVLFSMFGVGKFGGIVFRILMSLPSMMLMVVSGVFSSKENAQSTVSLGVGIYAGITVVSLTLQWGLCVIFAGIKSDDASVGGAEAAPAAVEAHSSGCFPAVKGKLAVLKDNVVTTDNDTRHTAGIMLLSLVPYVVVQLVNVFNTLAATHVMTLIALIVSSLSLLSYFGYQMWNPWMQERSLSYTNYQIFREGFLHYLGGQGQLVDEKGKPNIDLITKMFDEVDKDDNQHISQGELMDLVVKIINDRKLKVDDKFAVATVMKNFNLDNDKSISVPEFVNGCKKWIYESKQQDAETSDSSTNDIFHDLLEVFKAEKENDPKEIDRIMAKILKHSQNQFLKSESLVTKDGKPNLEHIENLFNQFDTDGDKLLTESELQKLINTVKFGELQAKPEDIIKELFNDFDKDGNHILDKPEFIEGVSRWLNKAVSVTKTADKTKAVEEFDKIVHRKYFSKLAFIVALFQLVLGIVILTFLGGPLMSSILQLSFAMNLSSFSISFIVVPIFMNARATITALLPASQKDERSASLTFSEIYSTVIMNNLGGLMMLLAIVYAKDLRWDFSAEVLTVLFVGAMIGLLAWRRATYPVWTCILAFLLYPFSLAAYYFAQVFWSWK